MILYQKCVGTGDKEELEDGASQVRGEESQVFLIWHKAWQISLATKEHSRVIYIYIYQGRQWGKTPHGFCNDHDDTNGAMAVLPCTVHPTFPKRMKLSQSNS